MYNYAPNSSAPKSLYAVTYDLPTDTWTYRAGVGIDIECCLRSAAAAATNGKIYLLGSSWTSGPVTLEYDPSADAWRTRATIPLAPFGVQWGLSWVGATNGKLYALGGIDATYAGQPRNQIYDQVTNAWPSGAPIPFANLATSAAAAADGKINLVGGPWTNNNGIGNNDWAETYDPASDAWDYPPPVLSGGESPLVVANGLALYVLGGDLNVGPSPWGEEATIPAANRSAPH